MSQIFEIKSVSDMKIMAHLPVQICERLESMYCFMLIKRLTVICQPAMQLLLNKLYQPSKISIMLKFDYGKDWSQIIRLVGLAQEGLMINRYEQRQSFQRLIDSFEVEQGRITGMMLTNRQNDGRPNRNRFDVIDRATEQAQKRMLFWRTGDVLTEGSLGSGTFSMLLING